MDFCGGVLRVLKSVVAEGLFGWFLFYPVVVQASPMKFQNTDYDKVVLEMDRGSVKFDGIRSVMTTIDVKTYPEGATFLASISGRVLTITGKSIDGSKFDVSLALPRGKTIQSSIGDGETIVGGLAGAQFKAALGNGTFLMKNGQLDDLKVQGGNAKIEIKGLLKAASLAVGSGNIDLHLEKKSKSDLKMRVGAGNVNVWMPRESSIDFGSAPKSGAIKTVHSEFPSAGAGADVLLDCEMGAGTLSIKKQRGS